MLENCRIDAILLSALVGSIIVGQLQDLLILSPNCVNMMAKSNFVLCQSTGLYY